MAKMPLSAAMLAFAAGASLGGADARAQAAVEACAIFTKDELRALMGAPVEDGQGQQTRDSAGAPSGSTCTTAVVDRPFMLAIVTIQRFDARLGMPLEQWREKVEALIATDCQTIDRTNAKNISMTSVSGLGDRAIACSHEIVVGTTVMGGVSQLHVFEGPRVVQIVVRRRDAETRAQLRALAAIALARLRR